MPDSLPPLPKDVGKSGGKPPSGGASMGGGSAFSGGLPGVMKYVQQIEAGWQGLAGILPSLTPQAADAISKLRMAIPSALGAGASQGPQPPDQSGGMPGVPGPPAIQGAGQLPTPPMMQG